MGMVDISRTATGSLGPPTVGSPALGWGTSAEKLDYKTFDGEKKSPAVDFAYQSTSA
jgi:hypothetical protein